MAEPFLSEIRIMAFDFAPRGWARCDGQIIPVSQNYALYGLLGIQYGGSPPNTFGLPDLRGRVPIHASPAYPRSQRGGSETHTLTSAELPLHTHTLRATGGTASEVVPDETSTLAESVGHPAYSASASSLVPFASGALASAGGSQPHENRQPYRVLQFCIALEGIYPSMS